MALLDIRQRTGWLFLAVILGHIILISSQVNSRRGVPLLQAFMFDAFAEVQRVASGGVGGARDVWQDYFALQQIRRENEALSSEVARLRVTLQQERALAAQTRTLQQLLDLRSQTQLSTVGADIIGGSPSPDFRTVTLDKGTQHGLRQDMAVIAPAGVVGRVILPSPHAAKVQLLIDRNAAAGALVERSREQGVIVGIGTDRLRMEYVTSTADIKVGDRVVTSGIDGIYPKGFPIGQIESIQRGTGDSPEIVVRPAVDFSAIEAVLVVLTPPLPPGEAAKALEALTPPPEPQAAKPQPPPKPAPAGRATPVPPPTPDEAAPEAPEPDTSTPPTGAEGR